MDLCSPRDFSAFTTTNNKKKMKIIIKKGKMTKIETELFQAKDGSVRINFSSGTVIIPKILADNVAIDIDDFDEDDYLSFYGEVKL